MADTAEVTSKGTEGTEEVELDEFGNTVTYDEEELNAPDKEGNETDKEEEVSEDDEKDSETEEQDGDSESDSADKDDTDADVSVEEETPVDEVASLRQMLRAQKIEMKQLKADLKTQNTALIEKDILQEEEPDLAAEAVATARDNTLRDMIELMELNPKFEDVKEVCSQNHCDDVVEMLAEAHVAANGGNADEVAEQLAAVIWAKGNPYKAFYDLVKEHHPAYADKSEVVEEEEKVVAKKLPKVKKGAPSLSDSPASDSDKGTGWTSAKIEKMDEAELGKVPAEVYAKYMADDLD